MRKAVNNLNEFGGSDARLGPRVAIKFFLDAISDNDLSTAITVIRNNVTVTTLNDAITSVQAQHIGVLATAARRISSLKGGGGGGRSGNAGQNKNLKKQVKALVAKSANFVPCIKADTAAWQAMSELQRSEHINKRKAQGTRVASSVKKAKKGGNNDINGSSKDLNSYSLAPVGTDVSRKSIKTIPDALETQLEGETGMTMADLPTAGAVLLFGQVSNSKVKAVSTTVRRRVGKASAVKPCWMIDSDSTPGRFSSNSHADTCVLGKRWTLWEGTGEVCDVLGFSDQLDAIQGIEIVTGATAWDDPDTGRTYVLMAGQSLWFGEKLDESLICMNQIRSRGHQTDKIPLQFSKGKSIYGIRLNDSSLTLPFSMEGCISYLPIRMNGN
jgi:hypothetical protein